MKNFFITNYDLQMPMMSIFNVSSVVCLQNLILVGSQNARDNHNYDVMFLSIRRRVV